MHELIRSAVFSLGISCDFLVSPMVSSNRNMLINLERKSSAPTERPLPAEWY